MVPDGGLMDSSSYMTKTEIEALPGETIGQIVQRHGLKIDPENPWILDWIKSNNPQLVEAAMDGNLLLRPDLEPGEKVTLPLYELEAKGGLREHNTKWFEELVARSRGGDDLSDMDLQDTPWAKELMRDARRRAHEEGGGPFVAGAMDGSRFSDDDGDHKAPIDTMSDADRELYLAHMRGGSGAHSVADDLEADYPTGTVPGLDPAEHEARLRVEMGIDAPPPGSAPPPRALSEGAKVDGAMQAVLSMAAVDDTMTDAQRTSASRYRAILIHSMEIDDPAQKLAILTIAYNGYEEHRRQLQAMLDSNPDPATLASEMARLGTGVPALVWSTPAPVAPALATTGSTTGTIGSTAAPAAGHSAPIADDSPQVAVLKRKLGIAAGTEELSGSDLLRSEEVGRIAAYADGIEDEQLKIAALNLALHGNAQDRNELMALMAKGEGELALGIQQVEASHNRQRQAQSDAEAANPEQFKEVAPYLGQPFDEHDIPDGYEVYTLPKGGKAIRRQSIGSADGPDNIKLKVVNGYLVVDDERDPINHFSAYKGDFTDAEDARVIELMKKPNLTGDEKSELAAFKRRATNINGDDYEALLRNTGRFVEIVEGVMSGRLPHEALGDLALYGADAESIIAAVARIEAAETTDKVAGSEALGELAGRYFMDQAFPEAIELPGLCWDSSGTFDQVWKSPSGEYHIVEAKGGGATNSSSVEVNGVRYQQGHPQYAVAIIDNMIRKHRKDGNADQVAELEELKVAWEAGSVKYLQVSQKVNDDGGAVSIDVHEYEQYQD